MNAFVAFITLAVAVSAAQASYLAAGPAVLAGAINTGSSSQFRSEDNYGNYNFGYDEAHSTGSTSRREEQINGVRRGSYALSDADGRRRTVNYVADAAGFRANIQTNEPGVEPKDPADVLINKAAVAVAPVAVAAPEPVYAAPAPLAAPLPAPIAAPLAVKGYAAPRAYAAPVALAAPAPIAGPAYVEAPAPRAFSYAFGSSHVAPALAAPAYAAPAYAAPAPLPAPAPAPIAAAPIYQERVAY